MLCPVCVEQGMKSRVYSHGGSTTDMGWLPYYDEDGKYHNHDPNEHGARYTCSEGHAWAVSGLRRCNNCDYGKDDQTIKVLHKSTINVYR